MLFFGLIILLYDTGQQVVIIIIMEICKAPTLRLKALNKHTHIMYIEMENVIKKKKRKREKILQGFLNTML